MNIRSLALLSILFWASFSVIADESADSLFTAAVDSIGVDDFTQLDELVVETRAKLVKSDGATLTYNVAEDPEAGGSNVLEILKKVPGVTVDAEDNVKVNGQSSFKILMNGREDPMLSGDIKTVLKSLPSATIKRIEVISEPGAKYDAEGVGGILNIVTDRSRSLQGFMTQLGAWVNATQAGGYINGRTKIRNVMLDGTVSYNDGKVWPRTYTSDRRVEDLTGSDNHLMRSSAHQKSGWDYVGANLNMSWEPDTLNLFNLSANYGYNTWDSNGSEYREMLRPDLSELWSLERQSQSEGRYNSFSLQSSYQHNFRRDSHYLVLSYQFQHTHNNNWDAYTLTHLSGEYVESPYSRGFGLGNGNYNIIQADYYNKLNSKHLMEFGGKAYINSNGNYSSVYKGLSPEETERVEGSTVDLSQKRDVYAGYGSYTGSFGKWNVKAGLRYEHTVMGIKYKVGDYKNFTTHLNDLVPNAAVSYNLSDASSLRLAYQVRISRPGLSQVNPFVDRLTPGRIYYGNPHLKSEKGHTFSLGYSNYEGRFTGSAKLTYRYTSNAVNDVIFMEDGIMNSTYANIGKTHFGMLELQGNWNITNNLDWSIYASGNYTYMKAESELLKAKNSGFQGFLSSDINYTLPSKWRLSAQGGVYSPWIDLQGKGDNTGYYYGLGASKSWLKNDALTVQIGVYNLFPLKRTNSYYQEDQTVRLYHSNRYSQWNVSMSVSFKIGGLTAGVKKTSASAEGESSTSAGGNK